VRDKIKEILRDIKHGKTSIERAKARLKYLPFEDIGFAKVDTHRSLRRGYPEVIFGPWKTARQIVAIARVLLRREGRVVITRLDPVKARAVKRALTKGKYFPDAGIFLVGPKEPVRARGPVGVISAGTGDQPVAEEAAVVCEIFGNRVRRIYDVGAAGIHRLLAHHRLVDECRILIVVAGMDGVLPSIVGGLVGKPIVAVPTSVGYGASFQGVAALLTMLNACAPGVVVVNIDNGFGAGYFASLLNRL